MEEDSLSVQFLMQQMQRAPQEGENSNKAQQMAGDLISMIGNEIQNDEFEVNQVQKDFKLKRDQVKKKKEQENESVEAEQELKARKLFKSETTPQEAEKIKKLRIMQRKHQAQLQQKAKAHEESIRRMQEEERQLMQKQRKEKNQERLKQVARKIEEIKARKEERDRTIQEEKKKIQEIKGQKRLHMKLEEKQLNVEREEEKKKQQIRIAIKQQKNTNFNDIKEHERRYEEIMRNQKQERERKLGELNTSGSRKFYRSKFMKDVLGRQEQERAEIDEKASAPRRFLEKKWEYSEKVRQMLPEAEPKEPQEPKIQQSRSVSVADIHKMGNEYMKQAHQALPAHRGASVSKVIEQPHETFKYKNYLQDLRSERKVSSQKHSRYVQQVDSLLKKEGVSQQQKLEKARELAHKMEVKKDGDSMKLIESINAKIYLLKNIEPSN